MLPFRDSCGLLLLLVCSVSFAAAPPFGFDDVSRRAQELAAKGYKAPDGKLPPALSDLKYDQLRALRFRPDHALWRGTNSPFEVQFFHLGFLFKDAVQVNTILDGRARPVPFDPSAFDYGGLKVPPDQLKKLGYAGFRLHYPMNKAEYKDEVAVFLGASYLRAVGKQQNYGLSSRGLAVDTAEMSGEEYPWFREFWIERPAADAKEIVVYALLDSRRVTGAYRFQIKPGTTTVMDVRARLFVREAIGKIGIAPLNSMFFFGSNQPAPGGEDFRPEVHDSDGLSIDGGDGEWIWRPLVNPKRLLVTSFAEKNPRGFGLMQRQRSFPHYEDLETHYEQRPSAWVDPTGDWGAGRIELVQIPTVEELNDNIVAYWVPTPGPQPGKPYDFAYKLSWQMEKETAPPSSHVVQTRREQHDDSALFVVDFDGPALEKLKADAAVEAVVSSDAHAEVTESHAVRNDAAGGWRMALRVHRKDKDQPVELRGFLKGPDGALSETWSYVWPPP